MSGPGGAAVMRYGSVCSGIEAATVAWHPLGWEPAWFAEIDPFPSAVLAHHWPTVPNLGDITAPDFTERAMGHGSIDILVGGTPCQSFSVAGLRAGLDDPRGNLARVFLGIADRLRPRWVVWENVPGVLSSNEGRDFGAFLGALGELGYGWAYRVLDAQYFGVAQRRRRVFVVGYLGDWRRAAAVLFERACLSGNPPPRREAGARVAARLTRGADSSGRGGYAGRRREDDVNVVAALTADGVGTCGADDNQAQAGHLVAYGGNNTAGPIDVATAVNAHGGPHGRMDFESEWNESPVAQTVRTPDGGGSIEANLVAHTLRADGFDASEDGTGRGTPLTVVPFAQNQRNEVRELDVAGAQSSIRRGDAKNETLLAVAVAMRGRDGETQIEINESGVANALRTPSGGRSGEGIGAVLTRSAVRRLTPVECARLQGFPDDYLDVPVRGKPAADGQRYRALGNSMAVPVMRWIGGRIALVEDLMRGGEA